MGNLQSITKTLTEAAEKIRAVSENRGQITVLSHNDADGIAAAGIIGRTLLKLGASFHVRITKRLDESILKAITETKTNLLILTDLGSGYLQLVGEAQKPTIILDHHPPSTEITPPNILVHVNPFLFGFDGTREISGAGIAYLTAKEIDKQNVDLAPIAVVGAVGDIQDKCNGGFCGFNNGILEDSVRTGRLKVETDLLFFGRWTRPISKAMSYSIGAHLPGLTGNEDRCLALLVSAGVPMRKDGVWRSLSDLTVDEKQKLLAKIIEYEEARGTPNSTRNLVGNVYTLTEELNRTRLKDVREFSFVLNACGRMEKPSLGISLCMGDRGEAFREAESTVGSYGKMISESLNLVFGTPDMIQDMGSIYVIRGEKTLTENMSSAVSSILNLNGHLNFNKPILVLTFTNRGTVKISARAPPNIMAASRLHLGKVMQQASQENSGLGGGHDVAAGAEIPPENVTDFLASVKRLVEEKIGVTHG